MVMNDIGLATDTKRVLLFPASRAIGIVMLDWPAST